VRGEVYRGRDAQQAARLLRELADRCVRIFQGLQRLDATFEIDPPGFGQGDTPRRAIEKTCPDLLLERAHVLADGRIRNLQRARGRGEAAAVRHAHENFHALQPVHARIVALFPVRKQSISRPADYRGPAAC
jgi:hypothetical protein